MEMSNFWFFIFLTSYLLFLVTSNEIDSTDEDNLVQNETYIKQLLGIGQITRNNGTLIVKILKNYLDETSCPQADTEYKLPDNGQILSLLQIYKKMIKYYYDISNESKRSIAILKTSSSELTNKFDELMKNVPQSICKVEYNKYTVNKNSNYQRFLKIFEYVSFIQFEISASVDILQSREYYKNYHEARDKAKKHILQSLEILGQITENKDLEESNLEHINEKNLEYIKKDRKLISVDKFISMAEEIYSSFQKLEKCAEKYKELIHCYLQNKDDVNIGKLDKSMEEIYVGKPTILMKKLLYIYYNFRKEISFENFENETVKINEDIEKQYGTLNAMSCEPSPSKTSSITNPEKKQEFANLLLKIFQSINSILRKDVDFISKMKSVVYTNSLNISVEIEDLKTYAEKIDGFLYNCSDCTGEIEDPKNFYNFLQYVHLYGHRRQIFDILHRLISIVNSNYDTISNCYVNEKNNITYYVNEIKKVATNLNLVLDVTTIENAEKYDKEALISLKNVRSAAKNCPNGNEILADKEKNVNQAIKSIVHESIVFFDKAELDLNDIRWVYEEDFNDDLLKFGTAFENLNTDANDITKLTDSELQNTLDKVKKLLKGTDEDTELDIEEEHRKTKVHEIYKKRLTSFINDFQKLNEEIVACQDSKGGTHEITVNASELIGKVRSLIELYVGAFMGNDDDNNKLSNNGDAKPIKLNCNPGPEVDKDTNVFIASILKNIFNILKDSTPSSNKEMDIFYTSLEKTKLNMQTIQNLFQVFNFFQNDNNLAHVKQSLLLVWKDFKQLELDVHMKKETIEINMDETNIEDPTTRSDVSNSEASTSKSPSSRRLFTIFSGFFAAFLLLLFGMFKRK